jgi:two-component system sensor histidine kinase UhpB
MLVSKQNLFRCFLYTVIAAGLAVVLFSIQRLSLAQFDWRFLILAVTTVGFCSRLGVKLPRVSAQVTVGDTLIFFAMLLYGGEAATLLAAAEGFGLSYRVSKKLRVFLFNAAQMACSTFLTAWVLRSLLGPIEGLPRHDDPARYLAATFIMALVQYIANSGLAALYTALKDDQPVWLTWRRHYLWTSITYFAGASVASITVDVVGAIGISAALIISPIIAIIYFSYRTYVKKIEASTELRESEERYRELFENAKDATYVHDLGGRFSSVNRAAEKLTGYTRTEILGKHFVNFIPADQIAVISEHIVSKLADEGETTYESKVLTRDGRSVAVEVSSHLIFESGVPVAVQGAVRDISGRKAAEEKLKAYSEQLRALSARLQSAREQEGTRIAREIHDELGSALTSLKWDLEEMDKMMSAASDQPELAALRGKLHAPMKLADTAIRAIRRIASELRPSILDDLGLVPAIEWQAQQFQERTGIICDCDCFLEKVELSEEQATAVFRILQEALTNVLRHAQATRVQIKINIENGHFALSVSDNGKGITESEKSEQQSLGILGMRERAHLISGEIDINSVLEQGTVILVQVPLPAQAKGFEMTN